MPLRIVLCGTPEFALPSFRQLLGDSDFSLEAVVTQPDRPRGRGDEASSSPIKEAALEAGVYVYQPEKIKSESAQAFFKRLAPDAVVVVAYGQIIPAPLLEIPRLGWINLHASLLPHYRGAAPIQRAILAGETSTGLTTMRLDAGLDTGPILLQKGLEIGADETAAELARRMAEAGAPLLVETLKRWDRGEIAAVPQDNALATLAPPLKKEEGRIDWSQTSATIYNRIRGLDPWPGAFTFFRGQLCHVWGRPATQADLPRSSALGLIASTRGRLLVTCGAGSWLEIEAVKLEGRKRVTAREFASGARLTPQDRFES